MHLEGTMNFLRTEKVKNGRNRSKFRKTEFLNRSQIFIALPKFYTLHRNYEILSKSLVPSEQPQPEGRAGTPVRPPKNSAF
jgi:hypothetical protein